MLGVLPGHRRVAAGERGAQARSSAPARPLTGRLLLFDALHTTFDEVNVKKDPSCPVCGDSPSITEYIDYVEFCQGPGARVTAVRIPPTLRAEVGGERQVEADGDTVRARPRGSRRALPGARDADLQRRRDRDVRQRVPRRRGRPHARRPRDRRRERPDGDPAARDGRWLDAAALAPRRLVAARPRRQHAARRADEDLARSRPSRSTGSSRARTRPARSRIASPSR